MKVPKVNAHIHTPYSFSAFEKLSDALDMASAEGVSVVGINDFFSMSGFREWEEGCKSRKLYPLYNIEFIGMNHEDRDAGLRVNDPANPGRTYITGKGLRNPVHLPEPYFSKLETVRNEANSRVEAMCGKLNEILVDKAVNFSMDFEWVKKRFTKGLIRERHLAKALRLKVYEFCNKDEVCIKDMMFNLFDGRELQSDFKDEASVENEIRSNLLKAGCKAFVPGSNKAFLSMNEVIEIIRAAGGIPTYPFLGDNAKGEYTAFERNVSDAAATLKKRGLFSVEFIPSRNDIDLLDEYASYLFDDGFVVTFGSEHNTPKMDPVELSARGGIPLTDKLLEINYKGACIIAAHQNLVNQGLSGYIDKNGFPETENRDEFISLGDQLIKSVIK